MSVLAFTLYVLYLALVFGLRTVVQLRRTGSSGFNGITGSPGSVEWWAGALFVIALLLGFLAPMLSILELVVPVSALAHTAVQVLGLVLAAAGIACTLAAQFSMGDSWRIGVDEREDTVLVTDGPFRLVRNPIFAAMVPTALGLVLLAPSIVAIAALALLIIALELQTRCIEEPYLLKVHGDAYATYACTVGRFVPGMGLLDQYGREERSRPK